MPNCKVKNIICIHADYYGNCKTEKCDHYEALKGCGYFGCHVSPRADCECTKCSMTTGNCDYCNAYMMRARRDVFFAVAAQEKCNKCKAGAHL